MAKRLRLRLIDGPKHVEFSADIDVVTHQIVNDDGETLSPNALVESGSRWMRLFEYPHAPWLDQLAERAAKAIQSSDIERCEVTADRILRFAGRRQCEAVWAAHLLLGHLQFIDGQLQDAISSWQLATRSRTRVRAVTYSNMGVSWALLRQPIAAIESFDMAIASDPHLFVAKLSRQNLAKALLEERADDIPNRPTWKELYIEAIREVKATTRAEIDKALSPSGPFPSYHVMHVFGPGPYLPAISSKMPCNNENEPAARILLSRANAAFVEEDFGLSLRLARRAAAMSQEVKPAADTLLAAARKKIQELKSLRDARRYVDAASAFFRSLQSVRSDYTLPEESLSLLEAFESDCGDYKELYHDAIVESIYDRLKTCRDPSKRTWLHTLLGLFAKGPLALAHKKAASICRGRPFHQEFWKACDTHDIDAAATSLKSAESHVGRKLNDLREALEALKSICTEPVTEKKPDEAFSQRVGALYRKQTGLPGAEQMETSMPEMFVTSMCRKPES